MGSNGARWRSTLRRNFPSELEGPPPPRRYYSDYEARSGVVPHDRLPRSYQNAIAYPPIKRLGSEPDQKGGRQAKWIPDFEFKLLHSLCARSRAVYNLYILQKKPARTIANNFGWGFLSQSEVYVIAGRVKRIIAAHYDKNTAYDWELAWMLAEEGASDGEIVSIVQCKPETYRKKTLRGGRRKPRKRALLVAEVQDIKRRLAEGETIADIAERMGVWATTIRSIKIGKWHGDVTI